MAKQGKGKKVRMDNQEGFVRLKARSLPIDTCWISEDWDDTGSAYTIVSRRHPNGNITLGVYYVDLLCLGVKQTQILYNLTADEYEKALKIVRGSIEIEKADYQLVHDLIYASVAYAKKFGFEPDEEFALSHYLLEEDTAAQREYDIDCGVGGKPMFVPGKLDNDAHAAEILAQLEKTAGPGNYYHPGHMPTMDTLEMLIDGLSEMTKSFGVNEEVIKNSTTFQFKIQIKNIKKPPVWRRVTVPSYFTFLEFHHVIQGAFGWDSCHLYNFSPDGWGSDLMIEEIDEANDNLFGSKHDYHLEAMFTRLMDIFIKEGQRFVYIYDFGDDWQHAITLEKIIPKVTMVPTCMAGKGACPPEDCGGPFRYQAIKEILTDNKHPEYATIVEWLDLDDDEQWDANTFYLKAAQEFMVDMFAQDREIDQ